MKTGAAVWAVLLVLGAVAPQASAQSSDNSWTQIIGPAYASNDNSDRDFIRQWEASPPKGYPTLSPNNTIPMKAAIIRYTAIVAKGGWRALPDVKLERGSNHPAVALLRERLALSGDLKDTDSSGGFDYYVEKAVKRYQASNGLAPTGIWTRARSRR